MVKTPDKVKIGPYTYTIKEEKEPTAPDGSPAYGYCLYKSQTIAIADDLELDRKRTTLIHEILHAVADRVELTPSIPATQMEEYFCTHAAPILLEVLRDNPKVLKWLTS